MAITLTQLGEGSLRVALGTGGPPRNNNTWRNAVGDHPTDAHFTLLADPKPRWSAFGAGAVLQFAWVSLLIVVPMLFPQKLIPMMRYEVISLVSPPTDVPLPPKPPAVRPKLQPLPEPVVEPPRVAKLVAPPRPLAPKPKPVEAVAPVVTPVFQQANLNVPKSEPARPREEVKTGVLSTGSAAPATVNKPINQVQTGGFGDPNGLPGKGDPNKRANINQKGSWDLPGGPGYGNGTGGANGVRGTVASAGFGNGVAIPPSGGQGGRRGAVQQSGFADASAPAPEAPKPRAAAAAPATQPVEIISKPNPLYTEEARRLKLEGEVLLEVIFPASGGQVQVLRVIRGLGHGLDEAAVHAAQQIRFKPAKRDAQPVDFPATVHIVFQMAY
jgi:TonB family protein